MAAFIQKLFKKRTPSASKPEPGKRPAAASDVPAQSAEIRKGPDQSAIDQQRASLAASDTDQNVLAELAVEGLAADIRLNAAQRLEDEALLQKVQKSARGKDKSVYQHTRQALQEINARKEQEQQLRAAVARLEKQARDHAATADTNLYEAKLQKLEAEWHGLEPKAGNEERGRILAALHEGRQRAAELAAQREDQQRQAEQVQQRRETLLLLEETVHGLEGSPPDHAALPSLDALQRTQENRWLEATRETEVSKQEQKKYETLMQTLKADVAAIRRLGQHQNDITQLLEEKADHSLDQARTLLETVDWPPALPKPESLEALYKLAHVQPEPPPAQTPGPDQAQKLAKLDSLLDQLEGALEGNHLKESQRHLKQAQTLHRQIGGKEANRHRGRVQRLAGQVRELGDWRGFATEPKQIALCEQMEYLADQPIEPEAKAARIQDLQQEWRTLGGSPNRELWQRFRTASDAAFEPCKAYFAARSDLKKINLEKRANICQELEHYLEATDWESADWKAAEQIEKAARQEWREAWPVEFRDNRPVQKTFDRLMESLGKHLDEERKRNEDRKQSIVEQAEALADHSPLNEAMERAKSLQQEWQAIGVTRHREDRKLWKAFRAACDQIFARRNEERLRRQDQTSEADADATGLLAQASALQQAESSDTAAINGMIQSLEQASATPVSGKLAKQLRETAAGLGQQARRQQQLAEVKLWQDLVRDRARGELDPGRIPGHWPLLQASVAATDPRELAVLAEIMVGTASPERDESLRMELQVKRLKQGFGTAAGPQMENELEALAARWCLSLDGDTADEDLAERFCATLEPR